MSLIADLSWKENENLGLAELNRRAKILADAIEALRAYEPSWLAEVNTLREVGLERLNTALLPAFQQIEELTFLGLLLSATSASSVEIGGGTKTFVIPENKRRSFAPTPFLIVYAEGDYDLSMVGTVSSYSSETGALAILVESFRGEGTFDNWTIGPIATTDDLEALRDEVETAAADVSAKKDVVDTKHADVVAVGALYYGALDTPPEGAPLGAQFLDTSQTPNLVKVLTEGGWAPTVTVSIGGSRLQTYVAEADETGPFVVDGGFTNGSVNVDGIEFFDGNGVDLDPEAGTFSFASPRAGGELVVFRGYLANDAVDIYTKAEADNLLDTKLSKAGGAMTGAIEDATFAPSAAPTKKLSLNLDGIAAGQTRDLIFPDRNIDLGAIGAVAILQDQKASGTNGAVFTSGAWRTRDITTEVYDPQGIVSISSNAFTVTHDCEVSWEANAHRVSSHKTRLFNVTDGVAAAYGTNGFSPDAAITSGLSAGSGIALAGKTYRIEHYASVSGSFGIAGSIASTPEVYLNIRLRRI